MDEDRRVPVRKSLRLPEYDYSMVGGYFVALVTYERKALFGRIVAGEMRLNEIGQIVRGEWLRTPVLRPNVVLDEFVLMPNHLHGILFIQEVGADRRPPAESGHPKRAHVGAPLRRGSGVLGSIIAGFKSAATKRINQHRATPRKPVWQRNYYDRIIRDQSELDRLREYIFYNPTTWADDDENPDRS
jgi:REP element-mobilizing transposase RayT